MKISRFQVCGIMRFSQGPDDQAEKNVQCRVQDRCATVAGDERQERVANRAGSGHRRWLPAPIEKETGSQWQPGLPGPRPRRPGAGGTAAAETRAGDRAPGARYPQKSSGHLLAPKHVRFQFIDEKRDEFAVVLMCKTLAVSPTGYYAWRNQPPSTREVANRELKATIRRVSDDSHQTYGSPRIYQVMRKMGLLCSRRLA
jgi:hypothetical protein